MENKKGSGIFLGVIGVATLIVAIIGATFAYFSATANSSTNAVRAESTSVSLGFKEGTTNVLKTNLIPASSTVAIYAANKQTGTTTQKNSKCVDDNTNEVCSSYEFTIGNPSLTTAQNVYASLKILPNSSTDNDFTNLYFAVYDMTETEEANLTSTNRVIEPTPVFGTTGETNAAGTVKYTEVTEGETGAQTTYKVLELTGLNQQLLPSSAVGTAEDDITTYSLVKADGKYNKRTYKVILWINETGGNQTNEDAKKMFAAGITFTTAGGTTGGVTGMITTAQAD